jgi:hypothetical protein
MRQSAVPILIISFNNYKFIEKIIKQLENILKNPNIMILDNNSSCINTQKLLHEYSKIYIVKFIL